MDFDARVDGRLSARHRYGKQLAEDDRPWWRRVLCYCVGFCVGPLVSKGGDHE